MGLARESQPFRLRRTLMKLAARSTAGFTGRPGAGRTQPGVPGPGARPGASPPGMPPRRMWLWFAAILIINFLIARVFMHGAEPPQTVPDTFSMDAVARLKVQL